LSKVHTSKKCISFGENYVGKFRLWEIDPLNVSAAQQINFISHKP